MSEAGQGLIGKLRRQGQGEAGGRVGFEFPNPNPYLSMSYISATHLRAGHHVGRAAAHGNRDRAARRAADAAGELVVHALQQAARRAVQEPRVRVLVAGPAGKTSHAASASEELHGMSGGRLAVGFAAASTIVLRGQLVQ